MRSCNARFRHHAKSRSYIAFVTTAKLIRAFHGRTDADADADRSRQIAEFCQIKIAGKVERDRCALTYCYVSLIMVILGSISE